MSGMNRTIQPWLNYMPIQDEAAFTWVVQQVQIGWTQYNVEAPWLLSQTVSRLALS